MRRYKCCVSSCESNSDNTRLHSFPRTPYRAAIWLKEINCPFLNKLTPQQLRKKRVCAKHFEKLFYENDRLIITIARPTLFTSVEMNSGTARDSSHNKLFNLNHVPIFLQDHNYHISHVIERYAAESEDQPKLCGEEETDDRTELCTEAVSDDGSEHCADAVSDVLLEHCNLAEHYSAAADYYDLSEHYAVVESHDLSEHCAVVECHDLSGHCVNSKPSYKMCELDDSSLRLEENHDVDPLKVPIPTAESHLKYGFNSKALGPVRVEGKFKRTRIIPKMLNDNTRRVYQRLNKVLSKNRRLMHSKRKLQKALTLPDMKLFKNFENLPHLSKIFIRMQLRNGNTEPKLRRFTIEEKEMCLAIMKCNPKGYHLMRCMFSLPSLRTLSK